MSAPVAAPQASLLAGAGAPIALACCAWLGALAARPVPVAVVVGALAAAVVGCRWWRWCLLVVVVTSALGARALGGLTDAPEGPVAGTATLVADPETVAEERVRVELRLRGRRYLGEATSRAAMEAIAPLLAGEQIVLSGSVAPLVASSWSESRHLAGRLRIERVDGVGAAAPHARAANAVRRVLADGAESLAPAHRSLLAGLTLGDDRAQPAGLAADFRAAGLTHLLAVSGQNLVFVLLVLAPLTSRLSLWPRYVVAVLAVVAFAFLTRFEPSVVRAAGVAIVALGARTVGRASGGTTHLALAVTALLVVDPLLARSIGFRLSVAACAGVLVLAPAIVARIPGPRWFATGLGITAGAQLAVAPVLVPAFGPLPLAALPANVAAGPIAGALMVWGITAGLVAGLCGGQVAWLLHRPTEVGLWALDAIASVSARLPLGHVDLRHLGVLAAAVAVWRWRRALRPLAATMAMLALTAPALQSSAAGPVWHPVGWAAELWVDGPVAVVIVDPGARPVDVIAELRARRVSHIGLLVHTSTQASAVGAAEAIEARIPVRTVLGPDEARPGTTHVVGGIEVVIERATPTVRVRAGPRRRSSTGAETSGSGG